MQHRTGTRWLHENIHVEALVVMHSLDSWFSCDVIIFQNKKNINPCEVLVLSYARPSKNFTFCNVGARQALSNRVRLNFQVCALRDIKMKERKRSRAGQKMSYCSSFG